MAKKIKKRPIVPAPPDPRLEEVDEERAFEVEIDDEENEVIFVHHYRRLWGDEFDADVEHGLNVEEAKQLIVVLLRMVEHFENKRRAQEAMAQAAMEEKATPSPVEKNPLKDNSVQ